MDLEHVVKLLELMEAHGLDEVELEQDDVRIRLKKGGATQITTPVIAAPVQVAAVPSNGNNPAVSGAAVAGRPRGSRQAEAPDSQAETEAKDTVKLLSPMVGTFYRSPTPGADPFVNDGEHVTPDTVVCIIEAMKVMNEIKAETEGEVVEILGETGESVEYGQPIMIIRPGPSTGSGLRL